MARSTAVRTAGLALSACLWLAASPATAAEAPASVIGYPASFFAPMGPNTAYDMVLRVPGFALDDGSNLRGFAGAAGNVLIDGQRPASKTDDLISILRRLPASQVERIDLIRGGAPGIDMQGKTVVANVIRKTGSGLSGVAAFYLYATREGYFDPQSRLEGTWRKDGRTLEASLILFTYHDNIEGGGPHEVIGPDGRRLDFSTMRNRAPTGGVTATSAYETPFIGGKLRLNLLLQDQPYHLESLDNFLVAGPQALHTRQDQQDAELGLHYNRDLASKLSLEVLGLQHFNRTKVDSVFDTLADHQHFNLKDQGGESIVRGILHWRASGALTVDAGGEFAYNWLTTRTALSDNGAAIAIPAGDVRVEEKRGEVFATATWLPLRTLSVEAGARYEASTIGSVGDVVLSKTLTFPKPRVLITWSPDTANQVRVRIEREVGQLDFKDFAASAALNLNGVVAGNPNLEPQRDWAFEAAYDRHFWKDGVVSLTARHLILQDVIDRVPVFAASGAFDEPGNIGDGAEDDLVASFSMPLNRFGVSGGTLRGVGTWRFTEVNDPTTGQRRRISGLHPLDAELHFSQDLPRRKMNWGIDVTSNFVERYYRFDEIDSNQAGVFTDVFVEYKPKRDLALRFEFDSAFDYRVTRQVFGGPRNLAPLSFTDLQARRFGPNLFFRVRKTFG